MWYRKSQKISKPMYKRYFTATPHRFHVGDVISPTYEKKNFQASGNWSRGVWMTNSPIPHYTVLNRAIDEGWNVYEVAPQGNVRLGNWDDYYTDQSVLVTRYVGPARGIARKNRPLKQKEKKQIEQLKVEIKEAQERGEEDTFRDVKDIENDINRIINNTSRVWTRWTNKGQRLK